MGEHKINDEAQQERRQKIDRKRHREADRDILAKDEPFVLESSETDPVFPAMEEYEVDADGPAGSKRKHPGLLWLIIAIVAVIVLVIGLQMAGDWA